MKAAALLVLMLPAAETSLFQAIDEVIRQRPFTQESVARATGKIPKSILRSVEFRPYAKGRLVILSVSAAPCIGTQAVMQHFGKEPEIQVPEPAAPYAFSYWYRQSWGRVAFAFARGKECLVSVSLDAPELSIGSATMTKDGTIILDLRAEGAGGMAGDARLVYPRGHKQYDEILKHLGGLRPGETKPVPPWPEKRE